MWFNKRIAWQLLFWFLIIEFPAESLLVYVSYYNAQSTLNTEISSKLEAISDRQIRQIDKYLQQENTDVTTLAGLSEFITQADSYLQDKKEATSVKLLSYQKSFHFSQMYIISPKGDLKYQSNILGNGWKDTELGKLFERVSYLMQTEFSDFVISPSRSYFGVYAAAPIRNAKGAFLGILMVEIDPQGIREVLNDYTGLGETGETQLFFQQGSELYSTATRFHPVESEPYKNIPKESQEFVNYLLEGKRDKRITSDYRNELCIQYGAYLPSLRAGLIVKVESKEALAPIRSLGQILTIIAIITLFVVVFASFEVARFFTKPIRKLRHFTNDFASGKVEKRIKTNSKNELGQLAHAFNDMADKIQQQTQELKDANRTLEQKVEERTEELKKTLMNLSQAYEEIQTSEEELLQNSEELKAVNDSLERYVADIEIKNKQLTESENSLTQLAQQLGQMYESLQKREKEVVEQRNTLEHKNTAILDSINYARRIQNALLPPPQQIKDIIREYGIFYRPRDIVSGDFYWVGEQRNRKVIVVGDCTGHGVPGALMSMVGVQILNEIVDKRRIVTPSHILTEMNKSVRRLLRQDETNNRDGMDIAICVLNYEKNIIECAGAKNPIIYIQNNQVFQIKGDKMPVGGEQKEDDRIFTNHIINWDTETFIYLFSDGYQDQFGGKDGRKFMISQFREFLLRIHTLPFAQQQTELEDTFKNWIVQPTHTHSQIDDVLVMGLKAIPPHIEPIKNIEIEDTTT